MYLKDTKRYEKLADTKKKKKSEIFNFYVDLIIFFSLANISQQKKKNRFLVFKYLSTTINAIDTVGRCCSNVNQILLIVLKKKKKLFIDINDKKNPIYFCLI